MALPKDIQKRELIKFAEVGSVEIVRTGIFNSSGAQIDSFGGSGGTASADDDDFTQGTTQGTPAMGVYESTPTSVTDNDMGIVGIDQNRNTKVSIEVDNVGIGGGTQYTEDDVVPANPIGTAMVMERDDALAGITPVEGDWTHPFANANGALWVKHDGTLAVTQSGTWDINDISKGIQTNDVKVTMDGEEITTNADSSDVDANNSTTTPLGISGVFTGTGTDCEGYSNIACTIYADEDSATDGMTFQFSTDNANWDDVYSFNLDTTESDTRRFQFPVTARYFRIVYTNGTTAQSAFRVQTILHRTNVLTSIHRLNQTTTGDRSAQLMKTTIMGSQIGGTDYIDVSVYDVGSFNTLPVTPVDASGNPIEVLGTGADNIANTTNQLVSSAFGYYFDGATWDRVRGDNTDGLLVNLGANNDVTVTSGSITIQEPLSVDDNGSSLTVDTTGTSGLEVVQATAADLNVTEANSGAITNAVELIDDVVYTDNDVWTDNSSKHALIGGIYQSSFQTITDGSTGPIQLDVNGKVITRLSDASGNFMPSMDAGARSGFIKLFDGSGIYNVSQAVINVGGVGILPILPADASLHFQDFSSNGEVYSLAASTDNTVANAGYLKIDGNQNLMAVGSIAHDAVDSGNPLKIGGKASDADPSQGEGSQAPTEVADADRVDGWFDRTGRLITGVESEYQLLTEIDGEYNNVTTSANSNTYDCWMYRMATLAFELDKSNTPTDFLFEVEYTWNGGTTWHKLKNNFLGNFIYDDTAVGSGIEEAVTFPVCGMQMRIRVVASGTDATNTFTLDNCTLHFMN